MARAERLEWTPASLYHLVLRHLGQRGPEVRAWLSTFGVTFEDLGEGLGWMPAEPSVDVQHRWLTATLRAIVSVHGTTSLVEQSIWNRLRDGQNRVAPRSMLGFFREAARLAQSAAGAPEDRLLAVEDAVGAIGAVGTNRVAEIRAVYEWVDRLEALRGKFHAEAAARDRGARRRGSRRAEAHAAARRAHGHARADPDGALAGAEGRRSPRHAEPLRGALRRPPREGMSRGRRITGKTGAAADGRPSRGAHQ